MDDLAYFQTLHEKGQADDNTLYLLGKLYKDRKLYTEALSVFGELMQKRNETLNNIVLREITEIGSLLANTASSTVHAMVIEDPVVQPQSVVDMGNDSVPDGVAPGDDSGDNGEIEGESQGHPIFRVVKGGYSESLEVIPKRDEITFKDVGGLDHLKKTIEMKIIKPFQSPEIFAKFRQKSGGGILLYGPPGCGKTFVAKATAGECSAHFRIVRITDVLGPYIGDSEQNMRNIFSSARAHKPCVLFFDEIDTLGFNRLKSGSMAARGVVDQLLTEIEGIDSNTDKLLIIGATNMPWDVDDALRRPGRFDRAVFVPPPDKAAREVIFRLKLIGRPIEELNYGTLADKSQFFSGADIENVVALSAERILEKVLKTGNENLKISQRDLLETLSSVKPSTLGWLKTVGDFVKYSNQTGFYNDVDKYLRKNKI